MSLPSDVSPRLSDIDWRWALPRIAVVFVATRLLVLAVAVAAETTQPARDALSVDPRPVISSLTVWDSHWFLSVAQTGYHGDPAGAGYVDYAFYPMYPMAIKVVSLFTLGDSAVAAIIVANAAFALALVALYALSVRYLTPSRALLSLWFLALAPGAAAFTLAYSDSLFLLFAVGAFLAAELRHPWIAGVSLALATVTRAPGLLLALPLLVLYTERDGLRPTKSWIPLALAPLALAGYYAYIWSLTGDPMAPLSAYSYWYAVAEASVATADTTGAVEPTFAGVSESTMGRALSTIWIGTYAFYLFLFVFFRHSPIRPAYWLVAVLGAATLFITGFFVSIPRYLAVAWPFSWALASRHSRIGMAAVLIGFATLQAVFLWLHFTWVVQP